MAKRLALQLAIFSLVGFFSSCSAQNPATNTPVPPLQWIELTSLLTGSAPPPMKYASIGYDSTSGTVLVFGGESNGFPTQQTYLLNTSSLIWTTPSPPNGLSVKPPPRSEAISGQDFAASNRHGHIVIGGKGQDGSPLSDAWEFDYINQFWTQINISAGGPSARLSASGGTDALASPITDLTVEGPNNTFYLVGGFDGKTLQPLSDAWTFEVAGVLSPNLANDVVGSWTQVQLPNDLPSKVRQGSAVFPSGVVAIAGGCSSNDFDDNLCAQQDAHVLNFDDNRDISPQNCPAPRVGPVVVPNYNTFSSTFISQAFVVLGTFNNTLWDDGGGLQNGEVDVFNIDNGVWTRILPSGDPGTTGTPKFPVPREGAAAISSPFTIFGADHALGSDTIIFGGQDAQGNFLNDVWLLRSYMGSLDSTNDTSWSGFGSGTLSTGVDASGSGVTNQYLTSCATALSPPPSSSSPGPPAPTSPTKPGSDTGTTFAFNTEVSHKLLSPISVALVLASIVFYRLSLPAVVTGPFGDVHVYALWLCGLVGLAAYGVGIAGLVFAFTTISATSSNTSLRRRSASSTFLKTGHGKAGLALFICLYGLLPIVLAKRFITRKRPSPILQVSDPAEDAARKNSTDTGFTALGMNSREKKDSYPTLRSRQSSSPHEPDHSTLAPDSPVGEDRRRTHSFHLWPSFMSRDKNAAAARESEETALETESGETPTKGFVVLNRGGQRMRRLSANAVGTNGYANDGRLSANGRSLSDLSWLDRRRSLNVVGELDYALSQLNQQGRSVPTPLGFETASVNPLVPPTPTPGPPVIRPQLPSRLHSFTHIILHAFILGICIVTLVALWERAPKATFVVFLLWTLAFYATILSLSWRGRPRRSILSVLLFSLREPHHHNYAPPATPSNANAGLPPTPPSSRPLSTFMNDQYTFPSDSRGGPYIHQPLFRTALSTHEDDPLSSEGHEDDDEDENARQRRIEQEMDRRDVSIVTVPKRKLWITNPS
ncbi:hypothetical protein SCHPADRAFT_856821 [Schizopora paradoxa]|uniref:Galactose oxidase n=1 Tax=Schizopora paradoxa TaxID=27342 RepID=A0A0H2REI5_9AGAM|nr:hypothetical protein SCHPADRAFT_856821 [Schizopora paradoxa]